MPTSPPDELDGRFMALALRLAERGLGRTWPNPAVGCVVVKDGRVVGRGWTQPGGRPHAEVEALSRAGARALGATVYVSLEPCAHYGRTPPCTMALIHAGVRRVVAATLCPDRRVDGKGVAQLRQAGIEVDLGLMGAEAEALNAGFLLKERAGRPLVTLKLATSLDGRIATRTGASRWITGEAARARGHWLRATHDALMIGSGTALADDPSLTCRLPGLEARSPVRVVLDGRLRLPATSRLAATAGAVATWLFTRHPAGAPERAAALAAQGVELIEVGAAGRRGPRPGGGPGGARRARHHPRCWSRAAPRSQPRCCAGAWSIAWPGSRRRWSSAATGSAAIGELGIDSLTAAVRFAREGGLRAGVGQARGLYRLLRGRAMFTGIITDVGQIVEVAPGARRGPGPAADHRDPAAARRDPARRLDRDLGHLLHRGRQGRRLVQRRRLGRDPRGHHGRPLAGGRHGQPRALAADRRRDGRPHRVRPRRRDRRDHGARAGRRVAPPRGRGAGEPRAADRGQGLDRGRRHLAHRQPGRAARASSATSSRTAGARPTSPERRPGDPVNLEIDMLARYVARQLAFRASA